MMATFPLRSTLLIALLAMVIAAWLPFDHGITVMTGADHRLHVLVVGAMALAGGWLARRAGLYCAGSVPVGLGWAAAVAAYVLVVDFGLARSMLEPGTVALAHQPLVGRLAVFMARAFNENVIYRLFCFSALAAGLRWLRGGAPLSLTMVLAAGFMAQFINIGGNVMIGEWHVASGAMMAYWLARYLAPGVLYAWLYWRYGFVTAEMASVTCHIFLQPPFGWLI